MNITVGHVIAYALNERFRVEGDYSGPHRDIEKNIETINRILSEFKYKQKIHLDEIFKCPSCHATGQAKVFHC